MANPRFFGKKDIDTFDRFNKELIGDLKNANSGIIDQTVIVYKISQPTLGSNYKQAVLPWWSLNQFTLPRCLCPAIMATSIMLNLKDSFTKAKHE